MRARRILDRLIRSRDESGFGAHGIHVQWGDEAAHHDFEPDRRRDIQSIAKGVGILAVGIAADDGLLDVDVPVARYLPDVPLGAGVDEVTLRHLLTMSSGIDMPWSPTMLTDWPDVAREFLGRPTSGRAFQYASASSYTATRVLETVVGDVAEFAQRRLFTPLGIADVVWDRCPLGFVVGAGGIGLDTSELARPGRLIRDRGSWDGHKWSPRAGSTGCTRTGS